jgi:two-component system cell cycle response regulator
MTLRHPRSDGIRIPMSPPTAQPTQAITAPARYEQVKASGDLPSPKGAALAIIRLTQKESVTLSELAHVIKSDPAFVGRLIKAANGLNALGRRPVVSIQDALVVLGLPAVRSLALGFSLLSEYSGGNCRNFDYNRFWARSLATATAMQALVMRTRAAPADEAFSVGLLAHIGELALATLFPEEYSEILGRSLPDDVETLGKYERDAFAMTHCELAASMMLDWGIPKLFSEPVFHFETPEKAQFVEGSRPFAVLYVLSLASHVADVCLAVDADRRQKMPQLLLLGSKLSLDAESLTTLCDKVAHDWQEWGDLLKISTNKVPPFKELSEAPQAQGVEAPRGGRLRILVVDDHQSARLLLTTMLTRLGHEVFEAADGKQGFDMAAELQPQLAIIDWMMPEMDGMELTRALRQTKHGRGIYVLILTALEEDDRLIEAFEAGVDDYMTKPLKPRVLAARLRAGQRVIQLQREIERDSEEIRRFAAELTVTNRRLQEAALTDSLTGFPNRRYAMERFQQDWAASTRSKRPLSCMVIDLDNFKKINDTFGHDVGDTVLKQTASALKGALRAQDVICRVGGDEFLVICPDSTLDAAVAAAERIRNAVETVPIMANMLSLSSSVSIGVAEREPAMPDIDALIKRADQGAYASKGRGRNCVSVFRPD